MRIGSGGIDKIEIGFSECPAAGTNVSIEAPVKYITERLAISLKMGPKPYQHCALLNFVPRVRIGV